MRNKDQKQRAAVTQKAATVRVAQQLKYQKSELKKLREKVALARVLRKLKHVRRQLDILREVRDGLRSDNPHLNQLAHRRIRGWMRSWGGGGRPSSRPSRGSPIAHNRRLGSPGPVALTL
jgi:hypothetical protein